MDDVLRRDISLQKDIDYYVNSGKWVEDMNKLEYEMNEVAKRAAEKAIKEAKIVDAKKFIGYAKNHGTNLENTIQETMDMYDEVLNRNEITKLVNEIYQQN